MKRKIIIIFISVKELTMKRVASNYELKKQREYAKKRKQEQNEKEQEARRRNFNWDSITTGLQNNVSFTDFLLDILVEDEGKLLKMYKRIKVHGKRLDVTGAGAIREITRRIKEAGGSQIEQDAIRGKIRRIENLFKQVSRYQFQCREPHQVTKYSSIQSSVKSRSRNQVMIQEQLCKIRLRKL
jgi:predicted nucleotidyltransferase